MTRRRALHDVLHIVLTPSTSKKVSSSASEDIPSITPKQGQKRAKRLWLHHSLVTDGAFSPCSVHSNALPCAADAFKWTAQESNLTCNLVPTFCTLPKSWNTFPLPFCFFQRPPRLGLLVFSRFLTFDRFVQLHMFVIYGLPCRSFDALAHSPADGVPVLVHERWFPSFVCHIRGVDERADCSPFMCT